MNWSRLGLFALLIASVGSVKAQTWPAKPVRLVVPYVAGGSTDLVARQITERLSADLGQQFIIDKKGGAAGTIGADYVAKAAPDGYTLLFGSPPDQVTTLFLRASLPYQPDKDLAPVALIVRGTNALAINPSVPAKNLKEFVALAKRKPGTLTFSSAGIGNTSHLSGELMKVETGIDILHVPHNGNAAATIAAVGGHVDALFTSPIGSQKLIEAGKLRALAVTSEQRVPVFSDVPTFGQAGYPGVVVYTFFSIHVPANTPADIVAKLNAAINRALNVPEVKKRLADVGFETAGGSPQQLREFLVKERERWGRVIKAANIKTE
jgi:tripartite-type tricarboxylate transporter receptor subunit TctC